MGLMMPAAKKKPPIQVALSQFCVKLIVGFSAYLADLLAEPDHLAGVSVLIVVPHIQHNVFTIF